MRYNIHNLNRAKFSNLKEGSKIRQNKLSYKCWATQGGQTNTSSSLYVGLLVFSENINLLILFCSLRAIM